MVVYIKILIETHLILKGEFGVFNGYLALVKNPIKFYTNFIEKSGACFVPTRDFKKSDVWDFEPTPQISRVIYK